MPNKWNITTKDAGLIGGVADGTEEELQARIDALADHYSEKVAKIQSDYRASFIGAKVKSKKEVIVKPVKESK